MKKHLLLFCIFLFTLLTAFSATFTVTSNLDTGAGTLRAAINSASLTAGGPHQIVFASAMIISLNTSLGINNNINLSGLTINGWVDNIEGPDVTIRSLVNFSNTGIDIESANNIKVYGIVFQNLEFGIKFRQGCKGGEVKGCFFGSNRAGNAIQNGIQKSGIQLVNDCSDIIIGGLGSIKESKESNLFVGCMRVYTGTAPGGEFGKYGAIFFDNACNNNTITGNIFGTDFNGTINLGNGQLADRELPLGHHNIFINFSTGTKIHKNLISGATGVGLYIQGGSNNTIVTGNKVGTNAAGTAQIPNKAAGIYIESSSNCVIGFNGGNIEDERNLVSGNGGALHNNYDDNCSFGWNDFNQYGIFCKNTSKSSFKGNYIGTDITGLNNGTGNTLANRAGGIKIVSSPDNIVGGTSDNERNVISGNGYTWGNIGSSNSCATYNPSRTSGGPGITLQYQETERNVVIGNYIGVGSDGITALGNGEEGVNILGAVNNTIGGTSLADANIICNNLWGVLLDRDFGSGNDPSIGNKVIGNKIGINKNDIAMGNGLKNPNDGGGVCIRIGARGNYIGNAVAGGGNIISGNRTGIVLQNGDDGSFGRGPAHGNFIYNNKIGTDGAGNFAVANTLTGGTANAGHGIVIEAGNAGTSLPYNNFIGGTESLQKNTISGNDKDGIFIISAGNGRSQNLILGNHIGINTEGTQILSNGANGINFNGAYGNIIKANIISGNKINGIRLSNTDSTIIQGNKIGTDITGAITLKNNGDGIILNNGSSANIIGGNANLELNLIANNTNGITVDGNTSVDNSIHKNIFSCNSKRGIVLSNGANENYSTPKISGTKALMTITGAVGSYIELYESDGCADCPKASTSNKLQGKTLLAFGKSPFNYIPVDGKIYTATASEDSTTSPHNTSEFSICYSLCTPPDSVSVFAKDTINFCQGGKVLIKASVFGGVEPFTFVWKSDGVTIKDSSKASFTAVTSGNYTLEVFAGGGFCSTNSANSVAVVVYPNPDKPVITGDPAEFCAGSTGKLTTTGTGTYNWIRNGVAFGKTNPLIVSEPGKFVVIVTSDKNCSSVASDTTAVIVNPNPPKPIVNTNDPKVLCEGNNALLKATGTGKFKWYKNGQTFSVGDSIQVTETGKYTVIATSDKNCSSPASDTTSIIVNPTPSKPTVEGNPAAFCEGQTGKLIATVLGANATATGVFHWFIAGKEVNQTNPFVVTLPGKYTVIVTSDKNCNSPVSDTTLVTVNPNPAKPKVSSESPQNFCDGLSDNLTATSTTADVTFQWFKNSTSIFAGNIFKATQSGKYTVIASTNKNCSSPASDTVLIIVYPIPASPKISASKTSFCPGFSSDLKANTTDVGTIEWFMDNKTFATTNPINVKEGGSYTVTIKSPEGCTSPTSAATLINVLLPDPSASIIKDNEIICNHFLDLVATNTSGIWKVILGSGTFDNNLKSTTTVRNLSDGKNKIVWDISAAPYICIPLKLSDTLNLQVGLDKPIVIKANGPSDTLCVSKLRNLTIKVVSGGSGDFTYNFKTIDQKFSRSVKDTSIKFLPIDEETYFTAQVVDNKLLGCISQIDSFKLNSIGKQELYIPNLITPNGDLKNDKFAIYDQKKRLLDPDGSNLEIYNRWGHLVYKTEKYSNNWTAEGMADGVYYYHLTAGCGGNAYKNWLHVVSNLKDQ